MCIRDSGYFILPTYPSDLACIGFDRTGTTRIGRSVPVRGLGLGPRATRRSVPVRDVLQAPLDLRDRVGGPVAADRTHLGTGQRLGNAVCTGAGVVGVPAPAALLLPQAVEATELRI